MLEATYTDGVLAMHDGVVIYERYFGGMDPSDRHLLMSVSKSVTSMLCGVLVGEGMLRTSDLVVDHVKELRRTAWDACTLQHLLDMHVGIEWDSDVDEQTIMDVSGYRTHVRSGIPVDTRDWIVSISAHRPHGEVFHYSSLATDVLAWVISCAAETDFAAALSELLWSKLGAEHDASVIVDGAGFPAAEGGICTTVRDLARFGQLCLTTGLAPGGDVVVPREWLSRLRQANQPLIDAFRTSKWARDWLPQAFYHDCWWIWDAERGIYKAAGMNGQALLIHHPSRTAIAKFSSYPGTGDRTLTALQDAGMVALCEALQRAAL
jgi:CubicO group peptidase (beta-lactamase class C family)